MNKAYGLIGGGWRAEFFLRISRDLPEQFPLAGVVVRDAAKREALASRWRVPVFASAEDLLAYGQAAFAVTSVPWAANLPTLELLASRNLPALSETPIAPALDDLKKVFSLVQQGARIQVAEQYLFQPGHAARLALVRSGKIGTPAEATVSIAHGYHGLSLLRHYLGAGLRLPEISARRFKSPLIDGPGRGGPPAEHRVKDSERVLACLDFGDKLGIYDFSGDQYFSWIRGPHLLVRGERGEMTLDTVRCLQDFRTPAGFSLVRRDTGHEGNLEGHALDSILAGGHILYRNPFPGMRWSDDEIAVATSLARMQRYVQSGEEFYSVAEACQDRYLDLLVEEAASSGKTLAAEKQPWHPRDEGS
jgi:predicted dehydrogenase